MCDEYLLLTIDIDLLEVYIFGSTGLATQCVWWKNKIFSTPFGGCSRIPRQWVSWCFRQLGHIPINTMAVHYNDIIWKHNSDDSNDKNDESEKKTTMFTYMYHVSCVELCTFQRKSWILGSTEASQGEGQPKSGSWSSWKRHRDRKGGWCVFGAKNAADLEEFLFKLGVHF